MAEGRKPDTQRQTPHQSSIQVESRYYYQALEGNVEKNLIRTNVQLLSKTDAFEEDQLFPPPINQSSSAVPNEKGTTATCTTMPTRDELIYQANHSYSTSHPRVIDCVTMYRYIADIKATDEDYQITAAQTMAHHSNMGVSTKQSVNNCLIYNTYSTTESGEQRLPKELVIIKYPPPHSITKPFLTTEMINNSMG